MADAGRARAAGGHTRRQFFAPEIGWTHFGFREKWRRNRLYLADAFGLVIVDQVEPVPGIAPGPAHLQKLVARIKADQVGLLIMEPYYERRSTGYLAEQTGIKVAVLPNSVGSTPEITTYFELFDGIVAALQKSGALK